MNYQQGLQFANQPDKNTKLWGPKQLNYLITDFFVEGIPVGARQESVLTILMLICCTCCFVACHDFVAPAFAVW